jgi:hypothetical protein
MESAVRYALEAVDMKQLKPSVISPIEDEDILDQSEGGVIEQSPEQPTTPTTPITASTPWPASGQEFYDWSQKQGEWKSRTGGKFSVPQVNKVFGVPVQAWVKSNPTQGYQGAAQTVLATLGG